MVAREEMQPNAPGGALGGPSLRTRPAVSVTVSHMFSLKHVSRVCLPGLHCSLVTLGLLVASALLLLLSLVVAVHLYCELSLPVPPRWPHLLS